MFVEFWNVAKEFFKDFWEVGNKVLIVTGLLAVAFGAAKWINKQWGKKKGNLKEDILGKTPADERKERFLKVLREKLFPVLPDHYLDYRVDRKTLRDSGLKILNNKKYLLIVGPAAWGKSMLGLEIAALYTVDQDSGLEIVSISWIDVLWPSVDGSWKNLCKLFQERAGESLDGARAVIVIHDYEQSADCYANRYIAEVVTKRLFEKLKGKVIFTSRYAEEVWIGNDRYTKKEFEAARNQDSGIEHVLDVPPLKNDEEKELFEKLVTHPVHELPRSKQQDIADMLTVDTYDPVSPLEAVLRTEVALREEKVDKHLWGVKRVEEPDKQVEEPDKQSPLHKPPHEFLWSAFPSVKLYWKLFERLGKPEPLKKLIQLSALGLRRTRLPISDSVADGLLDKRTGGGGHPFVLRSEERGARQPDSGIRNYELAHPTVAYLATHPDLRGDLRPDDVAVSVLLPHEQRLVDLYFKIRGQQPGPVEIEHSLVEKEPLAASLLMAEAMGCYDTLYAHLVLRQQIYPDADDQKYKCPEILGKRLADDVVKACKSNPELLVTACRLAETLYQQLDIWDLSGEIVTRLSEDILASDKTIFHWESPRADDTLLSHIGRELLRQSCITHRLEENLKTKKLDEAFEDEPPLKFDALLQQWESSCARWKEDPAEEKLSEEEKEEKKKESELLKATFAGYCAVLANVHSQAFRMRSASAFSLEARKIFLELGWRADAFRSVLNLVYAYRAFRDKVPDDLNAIDAIDLYEDLAVSERGHLGFRELLAGTDISLPDDQGTLREECAQELVYGLCLATRLRLAFDPQDLTHCRILLDRAKEINATFPGDEWVSIQLEFIDLEMELLRLLSQIKTVADDLFDALDLERQRVMQRAIRWLGKSEVRIPYDTAVALWLDKLCYHLLQQKSEPKSDWAPVKLIKDIQGCDSTVPLKLFLQKLLQDGEKGIAYENKDGVHRLEFVPASDKQALARWRPKDIYEGLCGELICFYTLLRVCELIHTGCGLGDPPMVDMDETEGTPTELLDQSCPDIEDATWRDMVHRFYPWLKDGQWHLPPAVFPEILLYRGVPKGLSTVVVKQD